MPDDSPSPGLGPITDIVRGPDGWVHMRAFPWDISVKVTDVDGIPEITSLRLEPAPPAWALGLGGPGIRDRVDAADAVVSSDRLRRLPLRLIANIAAQAQMATQDTVDEVAAEVMAVLEADRVDWPQGRRRPDEHYQEVADAYRSALAKRQPPVKTIQDRWVVGRAMASRYVAEARKRGYLDYPSRAGVAGTGSAESPVKKNPAPNQARKRTTKKGQ